MEWLACPHCLAPYQDAPHHAPSPHLPRVLLACGHTFCHHCLALAHAHAQLTCFLCQRVSHAPTVEQFPVNETVLAQARKVHLQLCSRHGMKLNLYCEKDGEAICPQCTLTTHAQHRYCMLADKAAKERIILANSLPALLKRLEEHTELLQALDGEQQTVEQAHVDCQSQLNLFFKVIHQEISSWQTKQMERMQKERDSAIEKLEQSRVDLTDKVNFYHKLHKMHAEITQYEDIELIRQNAQRNFLMQHDTPARTDLTTPKLEVRKTNCLQDIIRSLQDMLAAEKKRQAQLQPSPTLKKPAVLQVNLNQEYVKRKSKPTPTNLPKKSSIVVPERDRGRHSNRQKKPESKGELKYIRQSSIKRRDESWQESMDMSQNFSSLSSVNSFMRSSRMSEASQTFFNDNEHPDIKESCLFEAEATVYHLGGYNPTSSERYNIDQDRSDTIEAELPIKEAKCIILPIYSTKSCLILGGSSNLTDEENSQIYEFHFDKEHLSKTGLKLSQTRSGFAIAGRKDCFYLFGGHSSGQTLNLLEEYSYFSGKLNAKTLASMQQPRKDFGGCLGFDEMLYAAGGFSISKNILNSVERYNFTKDKWESMPHMHHQRHSFVLLSIPKGLLAIGGHNTLNALADVEFFDFSSGKWQKMRPMRQARCHFSVCLSRDYERVTVFGGFNNEGLLDSIEQLHIPSGRWSDKGVMRNKRCLHASILSPL